MAIIVFIVALVVVALTYYYKKFIAPYNHISGPPILPILGNGLEFFNSSNAQNLDKIVRLSKIYRPFWRVFLGPFNAFVIVEDPKDVEVIMSSPKMITKSDDYDVMKNWLQEGLLTSTGRKWFARRKVITPTFHFKILEQFIEVFDRQSDVFVECLSQYKNKGAFDVFPNIANCALDIICETAMGVKVNAQTDKNSRYVETIDFITDILFKRIMDYTKRNDFLYQFTKMCKDEKEAMEFLHSFTGNVIKLRRQELFKQNNQGKINENMDNVDEVFGAKKKIAFLDLLLQSTIDGKPLSDLDIREEVDTFMFEGHDTTASAMGFAVYEIAKHPEVQKKCFQEICRVFGEDFKIALTIQHLNELHYMELVIKETLRLYPATVLMGRKAIEDFEVNGKIIPKGASVLLSPYLMGRDSKHFENPDEFIPERFETFNEDNKKNSFVYIPFSAGQRNCIGQKFAMYEMKSTLTKLLRHYNLSVINNFKPILSPQLVLRPENGIEIAITER